jgi:hypothetical protein
VLTTSSPASTCVAVSYTHGDHIGNVELFPQAMLLVQKAEYDWPGANNAPRFKPAHPVTKLDGDKDVFGDGSVTTLATPGHTPGHQSLLVKLTPCGRTRALARCIPSSRRCIWDTLVWACRRYSARGSGLYAGLCHCWLHGPVSFPADRATSAVCRWWRANRGVPAGLWERLGALATPSAPLR